MPVPTTTIVMEAPVFKDRAMHADRFANTILQQAECLYSIADMPYPGIAIAEAVDANELEPVLSAGINKAGEFLAGAELYRLRKQYSLSAFMLHQSAEQSLLSLLSVTMGFRVNTHNVERLLRYGSFLAGALATLFKFHREEDKRLIRLLQKAYIDTRYKEAYKISNDELACLTEKVGHIHEILADVGKSIFNTPTNAIV